MLNEEMIKSRRDIVHDNFFNMLNERHITQKKYAQDNNIAESTISKWKSKITSMSVDDVIVAAKYFNVYANDLMYSEKERREIEVLSTKSYDPIMAQRQVKIKRLDKNIAECKNSLFSMSLASIIVACLLATIIPSTIAYAIMALIIPVASIFIFRYIYSKGESFTINYLDDVAYKIDNSNNDKRLGFIILNLLSALIDLGFIVVLILSKALDLSLVIVGVILLATNLLYSIISSIIAPRKLKSYIDGEYDRYIEFMLYGYYIGLAIPLLFVGSVIEAFSSSWYYLFMIVIPILNAISFKIVLDKYSCYSPVYFEYGNSKERRLFDINN